MKKYIILASIILFVKMLTAQFYLANTPDLSISNTNNVQNTGNDIAEYGLYLNKDVKVMVWDGDNPGVHWSLDTLGGVVINSGTIPIDTGTGNTNVYDPDVALSEGGTVALVAYEANGYIYVCSKEYSNNQFQHKYGPFLFGRGTNPNVDAAHRYKDISCVVTWEYNGEILAKACNIEGLDTSSTLVIKESTGDPRYKRPDVALYYQEALTDTFTIVSFAYVGEKPNGNWLYGVVQFYLDSLTDPTKGYLDVLKYPNRTPSPGPFQYIMEVGYPRIAAPILLQDTFDFSMVLDIFRFNHLISEYVYEILNFTCYSNVLFLHKGLNQPQPPLFFPPPTFATTPFENRKPVITYGGDNIHVAWEYYDEPDEIRQNLWHIIKLPLDLDGTPSDDYSVVNHDIFSSHQKPSIAGRFSYYDQNLYTFYDPFTEEVQYKASDVGNQYLRQLKPILEFRVYPNPTSGMVYYTIPFDETPSSMSLYDSKGIMITTKTDLDNEGVFDLSYLPSGIYFLKVISDQKAESIRICKQ